MTVADRRKVGFASVVMVLIASFLNQLTKAIQADLDLLLKTRKNFSKNIT